MGLGRFMLKNMVPGYRTINTIKYIAEEGLVDGVKNNIKEEFYEDNSITSKIYNEGASDGNQNPRSCSCFYMDIYT